MVQKLFSDRFIPIFDGDISCCRKIHDHFIIFGRDGIIAGVRSSNPRLNMLKNIYTAMSPEDARRINNLCNDFELQWLIVDTDAGCAAIYTGLYGISRLLLAVIFDSPKEAVSNFFTALGNRSVNISPSVQALAEAAKAAPHISAISDTFEMAVSAFTYERIAEARYSLGANIGTFLAGQILKIADFIGCIGSCRTNLEYIPALSDFSAEIFTFMSSCAILFARNAGITRSFCAKVGKYKDRLLISFRVDVEKDFLLYSNYTLNNELLRLCERTALERDTFFDCSLLNAESTSVALSFVPETDPLIARRIKQDIRALMETFWD